MNGWTWYLGISVWIWAAMQWGARVAEAGSHCGRFYKGGKKVQSRLFFQIAFFGSSLLVPSTVLSLKCSMLSIFEWFPGECSLRPIDGGDHPEDCSGQVPLTALRHHVRPAGWLLEPENSRESCEPWWSCEAPGNHVSLGNPGDCPVLDPSLQDCVNLCSCFAEPISNVRQQHDVCQILNFCQ